MRILYVFLIFLFLLRSVGTQDPVENNRNIFIIFFHNFEFLVEKLILLNHKYNLCVQCIKYQIYLKFLY